MSSFSLKLLAMTTMLIDHVGLMFFPSVLMFRIIGRLSFPIFAWSIGNGFLHTRDAKKYLLRLFIFAVISDLPYKLFLFAANSPLEFNIGFTLFFGLLALVLMKNVESKWAKVLILTSISLSAEFLMVSYGFFGVLSIVGFYEFYQSKKAMLIFQICLTVLYFFLYPLTKLINTGDFTYTASRLITIFSITSLFFIFKYNGEKGKGTKYLFYIFYPAHLFLLFILKSLIG